MALIKEDFYPKRPTRESWLDALPELSVAAYLAVAPWFAGEAALWTIMLEAPFLLFLFFAVLCRTSESRFVRWFGVGWAAIIFLGIVVASTVIERQWTMLFGLLALLVAHVPVLFRRERWLQRHMVGARAGVRIALLYGLLFVAPLLALPAAGILPSLGQEGAEKLMLSTWGVSYFVAVGLLDAFRILVPPPADAGAGWWKWGKPSPDA